MVDKVDEIQWNFFGWGEKIKNLLDQVENGRSRIEIRKFAKIEK
jgi:hypothetical protein